MGLLKKIRSKDPKERHVYAMITALICVVVIIIFWIMGISGRFERSEEETPEGTKPFQVIGNMFSSGFREFQEERPRLRDINAEDDDLFIEDGDPSNDDLPSAAEILETIRQNTAQNNNQDSDEVTEQSDSAESDQDTESTDDPEIVDGIEIIEVTE